MAPVYRYRAALFDLFGTLVDGRGNAAIGAREALETVAPLPWGIVTSCQRDLAHALLRRSALPIPSVLVSAEDVPRQKPAPDGYARAAELLGIAPEFCVVFEDSTSGLAAARAAGMRAVSVLRGWSVIELAISGGELVVWESPAR